MLQNPGLSWPDGPHDLLCMCMPAGLATFLFTKTSSSARREIRASRDILPGNKTFLNLLLYLHD